ncbi:Uncharacterized protein Rs2_12473 [Raphanus sativus]|nr:Uncharacterized protein Rs2_12473 [Raphanus sativus]
MSLKATILISSHGVCLAYKTLNLTARRRITPHRFQDALFVVQMTADEACLVIVVTLLQGFITCMTHIVNKFFSSSPPWHLLPEVPIPALRPNEYCVVCLFSFEQERTLENLC